MQYLAVCWHQDSNRNTTAIPSMKEFGGSDMLCYDWHKIMEMA